MKEILSAIRERRDQFCQSIAQRIKNTDRRTAGHYAVIFGIVVCGILAVLLILLVVLWSFFGKKVIATVSMTVMAYILFLSYKMNQEDHWAARRQRDNADDLEIWAESIYGYVRDAMVLALRAIADYTNIVRPSCASVIEVPEAPYIIEDGYVVFNFSVKVCGTVDPSQFKTDLECTLRQMHRAHELNGFSRDLVEINGAYYCPLQILGKPQDFGDHVQVSIVLANEKTVALTHAHKLLNLDNVKRSRGHRTKTPHDDEL